MLPPQQTHDAVSGLLARNLVAIFTVLQFLLHLIAVLDSSDPWLVPPHLVAWLQDMVLLSLLLAVMRGSQAMLPVGMNRLGAEILLSLIMFAGAALSIYPQMLREYLSFPVNLFSVGSDSALIFLVSYLGVSRLIPVLVAIIAGVAGLLFFVRPTALPDRMKRTLGAAWAILVIGGLVTLPRSPHPVINSLREELAGLISNRPRQVPSLLPARHRIAGSNADESHEVDIPGPLKADHIYLIVLEGVTADDFEDRWLHPRSSGFYRRISRNGRYFDRYYSTNLDSYTSLIAMLTSWQVPYRSYGDTGLYEAVNNAPNLVRSFRNKGYECLFVSTYDDQPFIPVRHDWSGILHRHDLPPGGPWVTVESSRMESATEDRAALSTLLTWADRHLKTFTLHELAYGHTTAWHTKTGISQLDYYDRYLTELLDGLMARPEWSKSLVVIVSDHGNRMNSSSAGNYRIPLLIVGPGVLPGRDHEFRSHLDLQRIIAAFLTDISSMPPARSDITVVGSTERWVYGKITATRDYLFVDDRSGRIMASHGDVDPLSFHRRFQNMIDDFGRRYGP